MRSEPLRSWKWSAVEQHWIEEPRRIEPAVTECLFDSYPIEADLDA